MLKRELLARKQLPQTDDPLRLISLKSVLASLLLLLPSLFLLPERSALTNVSTLEALCRYGGDAALRSLTLSSSSSYCVMFTTLFTRVATALLLQLHVPSTAWYGYASSVSMPPSATPPPQSSTTVSTLIITSD